MSATRIGLPKNPFALLSKREQEVLRLVAHDRTDREIARELEIRERTVRAHVSRIILKLGVSSRVGAAVAFVTWTMLEGIRQGGSSDMSEEPMGKAGPAASGSFAGRLWSGGAEPARPNGTVGRG